MERISAGGDNWSSDAVKHLAHLAMDNADLFGVNNNLSKYRIQLLKLGIVRTAHALDIAQQQTSNRQEVNEIEHLRKIKNALVKFVNSAMQSLEAQGDIAKADSARVQSAFKSDLDLTVPDETVIRE